MSRRARSNAAGQLSTQAASLGFRFGGPGMHCGPAKPRDAVGRSMKRAQSLRRRSLGFARLCATVRISGSQGLDKVLPDLLDEAPRPTALQAYLITAPRWVKGTPRDTLTGWVRRVGTGRQSQR